jgi:GR25 family glycosyltransferase involved in LPS biosynthesis
MFIDKIIVINLDRAKERKTKLIESFNRVGVNINDVLFLSGFDNQYLNNSFERTIFGRSMGRTFAKGEICCTLSHITAIKIAKTLGYKNILILEDDIELSDSFLNGIDNIEKQLPKNWDQIYIGGIVSGLGEKKSENIYKIKTDSMMGTHSYLLNNSAYDLVSNNLLGFNTSTDGEFNILHIKNILNTFIYVPFLTYQYDGFSYITNSDKKMQNITNKYFKR